MTNEEALELSKKGFTAEEIRALGWSAETKDEPAKPEEHEDTKTRTESEVKSEPSKEINTDFMDAIKKMNETIDGLTKSVKAIQENNQKTATIPDDNNRPKSADEVIKGFIENT